ncbi:hypothetical protein KR222_008642, partial [Zaprionus bogoriensis]
MRVVRLNFSHGSHDSHCRSIQAARIATDMYAKQLGVYRPVAIALDTKGPEIRTGQLEDSASLVELKRGDRLTLTTNPKQERCGTKELIYVNYKKLAKTVKPCGLIYIDDGLIALQVKKICGADVLCEVINGGRLGSCKGVNLPGVAVDLPNISEQDKCDLRFGVQHTVDMIFASFVRNAKAIEEIRTLLGTDGRHIKIISKIEDAQGVQNIEEIIRVSDGIMVARGDLGIELPVEDVVLAQKSLIAKCNKAGKPVICATHMLESMTNMPRPTRAEVSDVANAIFDGADCVMLSGETANGKYPVECVKCMADICAKVESVLWYEHIQSEVKNIIKSTGADHVSAVTSGIAEIAALGDAKAIVVASLCPLVVELLSQYRPRCAIIMLTGNERMARQALIYRGVFPIVIEAMRNGCTDFGRILGLGLEKMLKLKFVDTENPVTIISVNALVARKISFRLMSIAQK